MQDGACYAKVGVHARPAQQPQRRQNNGDDEHLHTLHAEVEG